MASPTMEKPLSPLDVKYTPNTYVLACYQGNLTDPRMRTLRALKTSLPAQQKSHVVIMMIAFDIKLTQPYSTFNAIILSSTPLSTQRRAS